MLSELLALKWKTKAGLIVFAMTSLLIWRGSAIAIHCLFPELEQHRTIMTTTTIMDTREHQGQSTERLPRRLK